MPRKKKVETIEETQVNTTVPEDIKIEYNKGIASLETGIRHEVDILVAKINEIIEKVNK